MSEEISESHTAAWQDALPIEVWPEILVPLHQPLCGPYAAALLAVRPLSEVLDLARTLLKRSGRWQGRMHFHDLKQLLDVLGVHYTPVRGYRGNALGTAIDALCREERFLVYVTGHFLTLYGGVVFDQHYQLGETLRTCRWRKRRIVSVLSID